MNLKLSKQSKLILLSLLGIALLGGISYGGWRCWKSRQAAPEPQALPVEEQEKAYEIIDNPDGSRTLICPKYGFKLTYPNNWWFLEWESKGRSTQLVPRTMGLNESFHIVAAPPRDISRFPTLREFLIYSHDTEIPKEPNYEISGIPAYQFSRFNIQDRDTFITTFENANYTFIIYLPWEKRDDPEYQKILNSFEFIESKPNQ